MASSFPEPARPLRDNFRAWLAPAVLLAVACSSSSDPTTPTPAPTPAPSVTVEDGGATPTPTPTCLGRSVVITRHAEKQDATSDPSLSAAGRARADRLAALFAERSPTRLVATEYKRTQETLAPLAKRTGLTVDVRDAADVKPLAKELAATADGSFVIVAGHSNTVPDLVTTLGGGKAFTIAEDEYSRVFILAYRCDDAKPTLTELSSD